METERAAIPIDLLERLDRRVDGADRDLARDVAEAVLRRVPAEQVAGADPEALADELAEAFETIRDRGTDETVVRTFDPSSAVHDWRDPGTVVEVCADDRPFLVASLREELDRLGYQPVRTFHPIIGVERDDEGRLRRITPARGADKRESLIHVELDQRLDQERQEELREAVREILRRVVLATDDYKEMTQRVERLVAELRGQAASGVDHEEEAEETAAFLDWLLDDNFILIGTRDYELEEHQRDQVVVVREGSELGVLRDETSSYAEPVAIDEADSAMRERFWAERLVTVNRSHRYSAIRQRTRLLNIWVKRRDETGRAVGQFRLIGLFSRRAHALASSTVPILRRKLERILEREDVVEQSYDERALIALFHAVPLDELFELGLEELRQTIVGLFAAEERREIGIFRSTDQDSGNVSLIVSVPRDRYDPTFRRRVQDLLRARYDTQGVDVDISLGERPEAIARFSLHVEPGDIPEVPLSDLRDEVRALARTWLDELEVALAAAHGDEQARRLKAEFAERLPVTYREHTPVEHALEDVGTLARMAEQEQALAIRFHDDPRDDQRLTRLKILRAGESIVLSQILPILESLGLTVAEELPFRLQEDEHAAPLYIHDYGVHHDGELIETEVDAERLATAIEAAWDGDLEIDSLNRLVLHAGVAPQDVTLLRAYRRFRRQIGTAYTADYQNDALVRNPATSRELLEHFATRFDPDREEDDEAVERSRERIIETLDEVARLDEDRILRDFLALIDATLRTNRYQRPRPRHLALKLASGSVPGTPKPTPHVEVSVYSPEVEGIHLRGAPVSRGGIRWSDRRDDYRSEVLDLMQAQMLKNSLIVPDGAKGAFVIKPTPRRPSPTAAEAYEVYIRALLEITDNVVGGEVVPPPRVRRADGDDPYLVVAADRGTATFSDLANSIAEEHDHWLGDAFASGGSRGYDHKGLGITARGAWVAVERHFRELGMDISTEPFTVVGIGDMSGDVFGNAMLRSRTTELVAAFDHRDVFIDPDPEPEASFEERQRLFDTRGATWQDYDRNLISAGGGVWSRDEKTIPLSDEIRELLRIDDATLAPPDLIRALICAPVDLLFAGGIGTFVKAYEETHDEVGDRTNAELRVNGADLRARVVGEGANLALTQRGRIEYARRGGRINTDFMDNVAGVDISDHEVNLKILLRLGIEEGRFDADERDDLLREVSDAVVASCLKDVERQTWTLYQEAAASPSNMGSLEALISQLERREGLDREVESLPDTEEMGERRDAGAGLTRPELAVLLAATKRHISGLLLSSEVPDRDELRPLLDAYFPARLLEPCGDLVDRHRLRRELLATELSNAIVDRMGIRFVDELARELGTERAPIVGAWWISRSVIAAPRHWAIIDRLDRDGDPELALEAKEELDEALRTLTREYVRNWPPDDLARRIEEDRTACEHLEPLIAGRVTPHRSVTERAERLVDAGVEPHDAALLASVRGVVITPDVSAIASATDVDPTGVATTFLALDAALGLDRLRRLVDRVEPHDRWSDWQRSGLADDLRSIHREAAHAALQEHPDVSEQEAADRFVGRRSAAVRHALALARHLEQESSERRLDAISVAVRAVRDAVNA